MSKLAMSKAVVAAAAAAASATAAATSSAGGSVARFGEPFEQFERWFADSKAAAAAAGAAPGTEWPNAFQLATVDVSTGFPSVRTVLMQRCEPHAERIAFYTNFNGRKSTELLGSPKCAAVFYWQRLGRQVRFESCLATQSTDAESDAYWFTRPVESRIASIASQQSQPLAAPEQLQSQIDAVRAELLRAAATAELASSDVPRPPHLGMWWLTPSRLEFWSEGAHRVHTREVYERVPDGGWRMSLIQP
jgi:pyridoxamine 5'-phosphate oxidase